ncbi:MAG: DUF72 domain-containing protein [Longimicrobiales bacterium]
MPQDKTGSQLGLFAGDSTGAALLGSKGVAPTTPLPEHLALRARLPLGVRLGTSSWSFPGWHGIVYDRIASESVLARTGLAAYAAHPLLGTVSVDRSYYAPLTAAQFREYADAVPAEFRFVVKADRLLTSPLDPETRGVRAANPRFLDADYATTEVIGPTMEGLGAKAGPLVFQFPPFASSAVGGRGAFLERLHRFLEVLPKGHSYAVELRTPAFITRDYAALLEATGVAHCYNVHPTSALLARQLEHVQAYQQPVLVVRWMLGGGQEYVAAKTRYAPFDRLVDEDPASRELIARAVLDASLAERDAFVIVNNKAEGSAPLSVFRLAERIGTWGNASR